MDNETKKERIRGFWLQFDQKCERGAHYLGNVLQPTEMKPFFIMARSKGKVDFEDNSRHNWTLTYNRSEGTYTLTPR